MPASKRRRVTDVAVLHPTISKSGGELSHSHTLVMLEFIFHRVSVRKLLHCVAFYLQTLNEVSKIMRTANNIALTLYSDYILRCKCNKMPCENGQRLGNYYYKISHILER